VINDTLVNIDRRYEHTFLGHPIVFQSRLLLFIQQRYKIYRALRSAASQAEAEAIASGRPGPGGAFSKEDFMNVERSRFEFCNIRSSAFQQNIDYIFQSISEMDALLKSRGIKFVVAAYPDEFQVNQGLLDETFEKYKLSRDDYDPFRAQRLLQ